MPTEPRPTCILDLDSPSYPTELDEYRQCGCKYCRLALKDARQLKKVISGGQTGADRTGLEVARELGFETGGMAARHWQTEAGPDPSLKEFGLVECPVDGYPTRTRHNVQHSDGTVWFGSNDSAGHICTMNAVERYSKPSLQNPPPVILRKWLESAHIITLNVAGNRLSRNPAVVEQVKRTFLEALEPGGLLV